jgi:hypothetical protein
MSNPSQPSKTKGRGRTHSSVANNSLTDDTLASVPPPDTQPTQDPQDPATTSSATSKKRKDKGKGRAVPTPEVPTVDLEEVTLPDSEWDAELAVFDPDTWQADLLADVARRDRPAMSVHGSDDEEDPDAITWDPLHCHPDYGHGHAPSDYGRSQERDTTPVPPSKSLYLL